MARPDRHHALLDSPKPAVDRRQFLLRLGLLAGAGVVPFAIRAGVSRKPRRIEVARPALGTWVRVVVVDEDPARASRAVEQAFAAIALVDAQMSIHRPDSQLARVNRAAGERVVRVDQAVVDMVSLARDTALRTGGLHDPTVLPLMKLFGFYGAPRSRWPSDREVQAVLDVMGVREIVIDHGNRTIGLRRKGAGLDLGSGGKGWALDRAVDAIRAEGIGSALVDVGGNVYGLGVPEEDGSGWSVAVANPRTGAIDHTFVLHDRAVATSGNTEQFHWIGRRRVGHLMDAVHGRPAEGPLTASVEARTGVESDLLSSTAFLLGPSRFRGYPGALSVHFIG
ncbi:MAG TPA: FAD:protein FMN transferase [Candidatus Eisenbacteria bacterium]|nr:FAD:protein FMN transferase [Candidatus Eisenbacteria bacterium]